MAFLSRSYPFSVADVKVLGDNDSLAQDRPLCGHARQLRTRS